MSRSARVLALGLALVALGAGVLFVPFLSEKREVVASTPGPPPLFVRSALVISSNDEVCVDRIVLDESTQVARIVPGTFRRPGPPLQVRAVALGFERRARIPGGWPDNAVLDLPLGAPPPQPVLGRVCVKVDGPGRISLPATEELGSRSRSQTFLNGQPVQQSDLVLTLLERRRASLASRLGDTADRATAFRPEPIGAWTFWLLAVALLIGLPGGALWALRSAVEAEERQPEPAEL